MYKLVLTRFNACVTAAVHPADGLTAAFFNVLLDLLVYKLLTGASLNTSESQCLFSAGGLTH